MCRASRAEHCRLRALVAALKTSRALSRRERLVPKHSAGLVSVFCASGDTGGDPEKQKKRASSFISKVAELRERRSRTRDDIGVGMPDDYHEHIARGWYVLISSNEGGAAFLGQV
jgi:hypothetical protein